MIRRLFFSIFTIGAFLLTGCSDNDSFSTDRHHLLSFPADTLELDTLFSAVPSSTYTFWVHNYSGDGLRIAQVRLERSGQSGFRVNVDGTFLNPIGTDFEIRKGDSLRVFVEVTAPENMSATPQLVEDNLLFTLESGVVQTVNLRTYSWDVDKRTNLVVTSDMTIEQTKPLVLYGNGIEIAEGATLTIKNTQLFFHQDAGIKVQGKLVAENVVFRGDRLDHMFDYLPYDRVPGQWRGITAKAKAAGVSMKDCDIHSAYHGLHCDSTTVELTNTVIHNHSGYGLYAHDSEVYLTNCQFSNTLNECLAFLGCQGTIDHCTIAQFYPLSADRGYAFRFQHTEKPLYFICTNTVVTGYSEDVVLGDGREDDVVQYLFENCLLRTPSVTDTDGFKDMIWEKASDDIQGEKHFKLVDIDNLKYDFTIKEDSPAYQKGMGRRTETDVQTTDP